MQQKLLLLLLFTVQSLAGSVHVQHLAQERLRQTAVYGSDARSGRLQRRAPPTKKPSGLGSPSRSSERTITASERSSPVERPRQRPRYEASPGRTVAATRQGSQELILPESTRGTRAAGTRGIARPATQIHAARAGLPPTGPKQHAQAQDPNIISPKRVVGAKTLLRMKNQKEIPAFESLDHHLTGSTPRQLATAARAASPARPDSPQRPITRSTAHQRSTPPRPPAVATETSLNNPAAAQNAQPAARRQRGIVVQHVPGHVADEITDNMVVPERDNRIDRSGMIPAGRTLVTPKRVYRLRSARSANGEKTESIGEHQPGFDS